MFYLKNKIKGFTLIELLVVISIVSLLSSVVFSGLSTSRIKARDGFRRAELKQIQNALQVYYSTFGSYPSTSGAWFSSEPGDGNGNNGGNWIPGLAPTYIPVLPRDPKGGANPVTQCSSAFPPFLRSFHYRSDGVNYKLMSHCAPEGTWTSDDTFYDSTRSTWAWMVCSGDPTACTW